MSMMMRMKMKWWEGMNQITKSTNTRISKRTLEEEVKVHCPMNKIPRLFKEPTRTQTKLPISNQKIRKWTFWFIIRILIVIILLHSNFWNQKALITKERMGRARVVPNKMNESSNQKSIIKKHMIWAMEDSWPLMVGLIAFVVLVLNAINVKQHLKAKLLKIKIKVRETGLMSVKHMHQF